MSGFIINPVNPVQPNSTPPGLDGKSDSGVGVVGTSNSANGVVGITTSASANGVVGSNAATTASSAGPSTANGVAGTSVVGSGVLGVSGKGNGVHGIAQAAAGSGVLGENTVNGPGVTGTSVSGAGVVGTCANGNGIVGSTGNGNGSGVVGHNTGAGNGVLGTSVSGIAISGQSQTGQAGSFQGDVVVTGNLATSGTGFFGGLLLANGGINVDGKAVTINFGVLTVSGVPGQPAVNVVGDCSVSGDVILTGADCAEDFDVSIPGEVDPGTVMVINTCGALEPSDCAYDKKVAGVVSGAGNYRPGLILDRANSTKKRTPLALVGKVYCKVDAQYGSVDVGDLLTTSPTLGHAMRVDDPSKAFGSVIGKALRPLTNGKGLIPVLVSLQ